jgi:hypothetical protein
MDLLHAHRLDEAGDVADAARELAAEVEHLVGAAEAQMIGRDDVEMLADRGDVELPRQLGGAAELGRVQQQHRWPLALEAFAGLEIVRVDAVDGNVLALRRGGIRHGDLCA